VILESCCPGGGTSLSYVLVGQTHTIPIDERAMQSSMQIATLPGLKVVKCANKASILDRPGQSGSCNCAGSVSVPEMMWVNESVPADMQSNNDAVRWSAVCMQLLACFD